MLNTGFTFAERCLQHSDSQHRVAFTLAEVLITLGIIGVVAAMTMPALMAKFQKQVTVNKLKKAYAEIMQAIKLSEAEYGTLDTWEWNNQPGSNDYEKVDYLIDNYIIKRLKTTKVCPYGNFVNCGYTAGSTKELNGNTSLLGRAYGKYITTASGYGVLFHPGGYGESSIYKPHMHILIDIDGPKNGENKIGKDSFVITLYMAGCTKPRVDFYGSKSAFDTIRNDPDYGCNTDANGYSCGTMIMQDGWEIKDDYPW